MSTSANCPVSIHVLSACHLIAHTHECSGDTHVDMFGVCVMYWVLQDVYGAIVVFAYGESVSEIHSLVFGGGILSTELP